MLENVVPNVCTEIAVSEDGKEFTLQLRDGVRWSDGEPFTADDIMFAVQDVFANTELHATPPSYLSHDGELAKAEKIDDLQVKIIFPEPNGLFHELPRATWLSPCIRSTMRRSFSPSTTTR